MGSELARSVPFLSGFRLRVSYNIARISEVRAINYTYLGTCGQYGRGRSKGLSQKGFSTCGFRRRDRVSLFVMHEGAVPWG